MNDLTRQSTLVVGYGRSQSAVAVRVDTVVSVAVAVSAADTERRTFRLCATPH